MTGEDRKGEVYAELSRLKDLAQKMREIAASLKKVAESDYADGLSAVKASWSGDSADAFLSKAAKVGDETAHTAGTLAEAADTLELIAKNYADAELRAIELAKV